MKLVMNYHGYIIKQITDIDIKNGNSPDCKLGEFCVFTKDNDIEYDGCETLEEAKEQIDGLKMDKKETKSRLAAKNKGLNNEVRDPENYKFDSDLNWKDDGGELTDPSMNDYLKGYQIDPYDFKQWASKNKGIIKESAKETDNMQMLPWYLADKVLTLWNGADGSLQSFFEAFTLRYSNELKLELAKFLDLAGYKVYPVLTQDRPMYASIKHATKIEDQPSIDNLEANECPKCGRILNDGECKPCKTKYEDFSHVWYEIKSSRLAANSFKPFYDMQMSDIVLDKTEETMSGNKDPVGVNKGSGGPFGYDATDYLNSDISVSPNQYETRLDGGGWYRGSRLKKKAEEDNAINWEDLIGHGFKSKALSGYPNGDAVLKSVNKNILTFKLKSYNARPTDPYEKTLDINIDEVNNYIVLSNKTSHLRKKAKEENEDEMSFDEIKDEVLSAIEFMKKNTNQWAIRDTLLKFTQWGFYQGPAMVAIDIEMADEICRQLEKYFNEIKNRKNLVYEIYDVVHHYSRPIIGSRLKKKAGWADIGNKVSIDNAATGKFIDQGIIIDKKELDNGWTLYDVKLNNGHIMKDITIKQMFPVEAGLKKK